MSVCGTVGDTVCGTVGGTIGGTVCGIVCGTIHFRWPRLGSLYKMREDYRIV